MQVGGFSLYGDGTSSAMIFATLKDWSERREASQHVGAIVERINQRFAGLPNRTAYAMNSPPLPDLGSTSGFDFRLQDRGGVGCEARSRPATSCWRAPPRTRVWPT